MRVLYVSKAMAVPAYRDKLRALAAHVDLLSVIPEQWGERRTTIAPDEPAAHLLPALLHGRNQLHMYRRLGAVLQRFQPDLIHIDEEPYSVVAWQISRHARARGTRSLFFAWQNLDKSIPPPFSLMRQQVFRRVSGGIAGSTRAAEVLRRAGYRGELAVIPQLGVDLARFAPDRNARSAVRRELGWPEGVFVIVAAGRLVPEKGVHLVLQAAATLAGAHVLVIGDGPERSRLTRLAASLGVPAHFTGEVESTAMPRWLNAADLLVLASTATARWAEQFGRVLVEAMACGIPVIGACSGEIPHVIGDAGAFFPPGDVDALAAALRRLLADPAGRCTLARSGRARAAALYSNQAIVADTLHFYEAVMQRRA